MRLLVVDDHEIFRRGVRSLLLEQTNFSVCGEAVDGQDAIDKARELKPDVIVMDVSMPRLNGLEATRRVRSLLPDCEVLILSEHENPEMARQALKAGARGYVVKGSVSEHLISALTKVSRREYFFDPAILDQTSSAHIDIQEILRRNAAFEQALRESEQRFRNLSDYQSAVMNNMAEGLYAVDATGLVTSVNPAGEAILGWTKDELLGKKMHDVTHYKHPDGTPFPASECPGLQVVQKGHRATRARGRFHPQGRLLRASNVQCFPVARRREGHRGYRLVPG
jgi:PAS domain S-box-containing protein